MRDRHRHLADAEKDFVRNRHLTGNTLLCRIVPSQFVVSFSVGVSQSVLSLPVGHLNASYRVLINLSIGRNLEITWKNFSSEANPLSSQCWHHFFDNITKVPCFLFNPLWSIGIYKSHFFSIILRFTYISETTQKWAENPRQTAIPSWNNKIKGLAQLTRPSHSPKHWHLFLIDETYESLLDFSIDGSV